MVRPVLRYVQQEQMRVVLEAGSWDGDEGERVAGRVRRRYDQLCQVCGWGRLLVWRDTGPQGIGLGKNKYQ
jgi:hypothetical protein